VRPAKYENERNCCEERKVDNDDDYDGDDVDDNNNNNNSNNSNEIQFLFNNVLSQQSSGQYQKQHNIQTRITKNNKQDT